MRAFVYQSCILLSTYSHSVATKIMTIVLFPICQEGDWCSFNLHILYNVPVAPTLWAVIQFHTTGLHIDFVYYDKPAYNLWNYVMLLPYGALLLKSRHCIRPFNSTLIALRHYVPHTCSVNPINSAPIRLRFLASLHSISVEVRVGLGTPFLQPHFKDGNT